MPEENDSPQGDFSAADFCNSYSDCVKQQITCCPCNMGGEEICMNKNYAEQWKEKLAGECDKNMFCVALYSCKDEIVCRCVDNKCVEE